MDVNQLIFIIGSKEILIHELLEKQRALLDANTSLSHKCDDLQDKINEAEKMINFPRNMGDNLG